MIERTEEDPLLRFVTFLCAGMLRAVKDPAGGMALLRLSDDKRMVSDGFFQRAEQEVRLGFELGHFNLEPDEVVIDQVLGFTRFAVRRVCRGEATPDYPQRVAERVLVTLGMTPGEAATLASEALAELAEESEGS